MISIVGFGGGCHWCTEAVFLSLRGVLNVNQGWIASDGSNDYFSEGVLVIYNSREISLEQLIAVHVYTHSSTSLHSMRNKYRSAVYTFLETDAVRAVQALEALQAEFASRLITHVLPFVAFEQSRTELLDYYYSNTEKPFCELYINPKLKLIMNRFSKLANYDKLKHLTKL